MNPPHSNFQYCSFPPPILPDFSQPPPFVPLVPNNAPTYAPPPSVHITSYPQQIQQYSHFPVTSVIDNLNIYNQNSIPQNSIHYHDPTQYIQRDDYTSQKNEYITKLHEDNISRTHHYSNSTTIGHNRGSKKATENIDNKKDSNRYRSKSTRYKKSDSVFPHADSVSRDSRSSQIKELKKENSYKRSKSHDPQKKRLETKHNTERDMLLVKYRENYCATSEEISKKLEELSNQIVKEKESEIWTRSSPADLYYTRNSDGDMSMTPKLASLCGVFYENLIKRAENARKSQSPFELPPRKQRTRICRHKTEACESSSSDNSMSGLESDEEDCAMEELTRKLKHPQRLHREMWFNDPGEMNDGPLCRCSVRSRRSGIRHGVYPGENGEYICKPNSNNNSRLHHYRITISPPTNFLTKTPTIIKHDEHEFIFEGFSMFSHTPLGMLPTCKVIRFNIEYTILYIEEKHPEHYTMKELDLFFDYLFHELLELIDFDLKPHGKSDGCPIFHFMPRFVRDLPDNGKEILSMNEVLHYLLSCNEPLVSGKVVSEMHSLSQHQWQDYADQVKGMVVTYPGRKPCSVRVDQLDRNIESHRDSGSRNEIKYPEIVHFGIRPPQLSYAGNPEYQKAWREYVKYRHLIANMPKPSFEDKRKLESKEARLQDMRSQGKLKRDVTVALSSEGFYRTGIMCDIIQHAMLVPVLACHLRFHRSLDKLEQTIGYKFKNRYLLQLALTHPSYRENFGTNPDHARNSLTNCGIRQPEYGDRRIHYLNTRKRGINTLINIMSRFGKQCETESNINHNERLEFLGDAVVEFLTSIHLFHMFPDLEEGGLATYRAAIVQNQHLAVLAKKLQLEQYMLYAHGSDLCHELELRHAMANCFEALMGALFLDGGIQVADKVFGNALFLNELNLLKVWMNYPPHPLQLQEPNGDRQWINSYELLQKLTKFESSIGVRFRHIRLLARAFTDRSIGFTNLTLGSNQRLEFLGDTVLQLISSEYLYRHFPEHHEGHLSLLRSSLVNNRTQAVVCDDLGMTQFAVYSNPKAELKTKDRADLLEALLGALYIDKGMKHCQMFCQVCLFPRLQDFIMNQDWNDPKSKLQQCCLTLRTMDGGEPDIPVYKVIECIGPTNTRVYTVAVYFRGERLATATGHSIQQAEMNSAKQALDNSQDLFPQLDHQKRVIAKSMKNQKWPYERSKSGNNSNNSNCGNSSNNNSSRYKKRERSRDRTPSTSSKWQRKERDSDAISSSSRASSYAESGKSSYDSRRSRRDRYLPQQYRRTEHDRREHSLIDYNYSDNKKYDYTETAKTTETISTKRSEKMNSPTPTYEKDVLVYKSQNEKDNQRESDLESGEIE